MNTSQDFGTGAGMPGSSDAGSGQEGIGSLISGTLKDLQELVRAEVQLAKTELTEDAKTIGSAAGMVVAAAALGLVGLIILMIGVAWLLAESMDRWLAFGIVGVVLLALAGILALVGKNRVSAASLKPEQTIDTLKEDRAWAKQQINSVKR